MENAYPFPTAEVEIRKTGQIYDQGQVERAVALAANATDILVIAHGWQNGKAQARALFRELTTSIRAVREEAEAENRSRLVVVGLLWPSVAWADESDIPAGGAAMGVEPRTLQAHIEEDIDDLSASRELTRLAPDLDRQDARTEFVDTLRALVPGAGGEDIDSPPQSFLSGDPIETFQKATEFESEDWDEDAPSWGGAAVSGPGGGPGTGFPVGTPPGGGGAMRAPGFRQPFSEGAHRLLNLTTYYRMRKRTTDVGGIGAASVLTRLGETDARLHVAGHSMGARVISVAANEPGPPVHSMTLLQGAFSHYGFAHNYDGKGANGLFRPVLTGSRLAGPVLVTHTTNDSVVKWPYWFASFLARQVGVGNALVKSGRYGAIGSSGALATPEATDKALLSVGSQYGFEPREVYNLQADEFIRSHSDVRGRQAAYAILTAMFRDGQS
ncbi:alpha/beta fold hydrolase [Streptomyces sp. bgisy084]|uniref:alpha/beta fold hydrolase n=1 Tax=Streptomyces sp. bgisy084 TaxID=3413777 RepID=UPI003D70C7C7